MMWEKNTHRYGEISRLVVQFCAARPPVDSLILTVVIGLVLMVDPEVTGGSQNRGHCVSQFANL